MGLSNDYDHQRQISNTIEVGMPPPHIFINTFWGKKIDISKCEADIECTF